MGTAQVRYARIGARILESADYVVCMVVARRIDRVVGGDCAREHKLQPVRAGLMHAHDRAVAGAQAQRGVVAEFMSSAVKIESGSFADRCMLVAMNAGES